MRRREGVSEGRGGSKGRRKKVREQRKGVREGGSEEREGRSKGREGTEGKSKEVREEKEGVNEERKEERN